MSDADATTSERLRYRFDNLMARGTPAMIGLLGLVSLAAVGGIAVLLTLTGLNAEGEAPMGFVDAFWFGLMRTLDAGTMGGDGPGWVYRAVGLTVTLCGIFIVSTLIGVINSGVEARLDELRKGRSRVVESGHTLILGFSPQVFTIVSELVEANANNADGCIVILAEGDKVEMEEAVRERVPDLRTTRVVCRSGSPMALADLAMVSVKTAKSVIVLSPEGDDPDASVIKSILAITNAPDRRTAPYHIVAVIQEPANLEAARLVGKGEAEIILAGDLISRITVQTCRQSGLSVVHTELLDFGGDEIYFKEEPALVGKTFGASLSMFEDSSVIGLRRQNGKVLLNPPMDEVIHAGDQVIAVSEDDDTIRLSGQTPSFDAAAIVERTPSALHPERTLILGWNWRAPLIVAGLDAYVAPGSTVTAIADLDEGEAGAVDVREGLKNQELDYRVGDTTSRKLLESLGVETYDHILVLCSDQLDAQKSDSRVLVTLLHLRDMSEKLQKDFAIVSEMLDVRNRELAEVTKADDFIVSEKLVSLLLTQVSENKDLAPVFEDLFDPDGSEIYVKPAADYIKPGVEVDFYTVVEAARRRGEIALGYKLLAKERDASASYGVVVNPDKSAKVRFAEGDKLVVIAES